MLQRYEQYCKYDVYFKSKLVLLLNSNTFTAIVIAENFLKSSLLKFTFTCENVKNKKKIFLIILKNSQDESFSEKIHI